MMETEKLIRRIEEMKLYTYTDFSISEGLDDPSVIAQYAQRMLGMQFAYDNVIRILREAQGCDCE